MRLKKTSRFIQTKMLFHSHSYSELMNINATWSEAARIAQLATRTSFSLRLTSYFRFIPAITSSSWDILYSAEKAQSASCLCRLHPSVSLFVGTPTVSL
jgi:hypothetical protein